MSKRHEKRCTECGYEFSAYELATENPSLWGHPCHIYLEDAAKGVHCESFRRVIAPRPRAGTVQALSYHSVTPSASAAQRENSNFSVQEKGE